MKSVVKKAIVFIIGLLILFPLKSFYLLKNDRYQKLASAKIVYNAIDKSKRKNQKIKKLIIGDSVGQQLFSSYTCNDSIYSLTSNQAISLAGQYFLVKDAVAANPGIEKVILIYTPFAFRKDLNQRYTFPYFLKPFYNDEYKSMFSPLVNAQIKQIPFYYISQFPPVLTSNWAPDYDELPDSLKGGFISAVNEEYLAKIISLCKEKNIKFTILPTPTRISFKSVVGNFSKNVNYSNYDFNDYFSKITYIPDSCFFDDVHLKDAEKFRQQYLEMMDSF